MDIIPQETEANAEALARSLQAVLEVTDPRATRVFLFGSWASYQKSFTEGDVDIFVGVPNYDYEGSRTLARLKQSQITVPTTDGDAYEDRSLELHWGDVEDFLSRTGDWERVELTEYICPSGPTT